MNNPIAIVRLDPTGKVESVTLADNACVTYNRKKIGTIISMEFKDGILHASIKIEDLEFEQILKRMKDEANNDRDDKGTDNSSIHWNT